ncbi:MAG: site-specific DNA-methyltransferase [Prevotellaceae bacterium]|nr:site-specific DNA-methyltransferase [Candidatus Faecinaster equi]
MLDFGFYNMDCMEGMKEFPDKYFDLAIVDPPYGINLNNNMGRRKGDKKSSYPKAYWGDKTPDKKYFDELFRVSKKQIIWGGNYFELPPTKCFIVWRKPQISEDVTFSMLEYAWTSCEGTSKEYIGMSNEKDRIHASQKPVALYEWLLKRYAKDGDIILDTHVGSASSLIAFNKYHHNFVGFELDEHYYKKAKERYELASKQMTIFDFGFNPYQE